MIDEDAGELLADGLVDQHRCHRAVDTARQPTDDAILADLRADARDLRVAEMLHAPVARQARDLAHEVADQACAVGRVHHLGVKHRRIDAPALIGRDRERRVLARRLDCEAVGQARDAVAVAHPHGIALAHVPHAVEQRALFLDQDVGAAELRRVPALDLAAELHGRRLLAVADRENGQAGIEDRLRCARRAVRRHGGWSSRENDGLGLEPRQRLLGTVERHDLGVDALLAHAPRDELGHLAAEVDDEDGIGAAARHGGAGPRGNRWRAHPRIDHRARDRSSTLGAGLCVSQLRRSCKRLPASPVGATLHDSGQVQMPADPHRPVVNPVGVNVLSGVDLQRSPKPEAATERGDRNNQAKASLKCRRA